MTKAECKSRLAELTHEWSPNCSVIGCSKCLERDKLMKEMKNPDPPCEVCSGSLSQLSEELSLYQCEECREVQQMVDGQLRQLGAILKAAQLNDDRIHAAVSRPHVADIASFIETFENATGLDLETFAADGSGGGLWQFADGPGAD